MDAQFELGVWRCLGCGYVWQAIACSGATECSAPCPVCHEALGTVDAEGMETLHQMLVAHLAQLVDDETGEPVGWDADD